MRGRQAYWNHNTAFHAEIERRCAATSGAVLDVGCGDGLLLERLAPSGRTLTGLEPDPGAAGRARLRCVGWPNVTIVESDFMMADLAPDSYGFVVMVAALHHMDTRLAFVRAAELLAPGGILYVLGIARIASSWDRAHALAAMPRARIAGVLHGETWPDGVPVKEPTQTLRQVGADARELLPGARVQRRPYYRYSLEWSKRADLRPRAQRSPG